MPTAISREEREEEKEDEVKEEVVVPDTLLTSISPDLVSSFCHTILFLLVPFLVFSSPFMIKCGQGISKKSILDIISTLDKL